MSSEQQQEQQQDLLPPHLNPSNYPQARTHPSLNIHLTLTYAPLNPTTHITDISSPSAGANLLFLGTTRDTFDHRPVTTLSYTTYPILAFKTLMQIAENAVAEHGLLGVSIAHRLGEVPVGECSIVVGVSAGHRGAAFRGGEEVLERCKERVEVWKREVFEDGGSEWRANGERDRDGNLK
ncbi:Molybdopterin synthase catalytic subunit [Aspergillus cristatus]|uniref:Molybdopterin synthase catalytic subunit n=1 Tax=Aspergillus cristatus TaxID=573508 RepID=A0A1E3BCP1_ASPCR|nr:Molybdopterin synthase catalytic subunit [Aspergillus cristatus]